MASETVTGFSAFYERNVQMVVVGGGPVNAVIGTTFARWREGVLLSGD